MKKKQTEKNYRSRYDRNRMCYRKDKTTYVYSEYVDDGNGQGHYIDHEYHVGDMDETGSVITFEMLDMLQMKRYWYITHFPMAILRKLEWHV